MFSLRAGRAAAKSRQKYQAKHPILGALRNLGTFQGILDVYCFFPQDPPCHPSLLSLSCVSTAGSKHRSESPCQMFFFKDHPLLHVNRRPSCLPQPENGRRGKNTKQNTKHKSFEAPGWTCTTLPSASMLATAFTWPSRTMARCGHWLLTPLSSTAVPLCRTSTC